MATFKFSIYNSGETPSSNINDYNYLKNNVTRINLNWVNQLSAYSLEDVVTDDTIKILYSFDISSLKQAVDEKAQYLLSIVNDVSLDESTRSVFRQCFELATGLQAYNFCALALSKNNNDNSVSFGESTHQSSNIVNTFRNNGRDRNYIEQFIQRVRYGLTPTMLSNNGINVVKVDYTTNLKNTNVFIGVFSYALLIIESMTRDLRPINQTNHYAPYVITSSWSDIIVNPAYLRQTLNWNINEGQTSTAFVITNIQAVGFRPEVLNFNLYADQNYSQGQYRFEFYSYWDPAFPEMYGKSEQQWNELLTMPLGNLDGFGNIDITIPRDYGNWVIMKVISYNSRQPERLDMLTVTAREIQNNIPTILAGYDITDLDFESNWYGFALDSSSNTTDITNQMTYCKVFRINNTYNVSGTGWVRVSSPDSNAWIYKVNNNSFDPGELNPSASRSFLLISEEELQKPIYIMVTTPNAYQTGWFNILTGREDFAGARRYQIFDSSFNELLIRNEGSPHNAFNRYIDGFVEENKWCAISDIQPVKNSLDYSLELIDDPRGSGKIWKITAIMNPGSYYEMNSTLLGETFYANRPTDLGNYYAYYKGIWNNNHKQLTPSTVHEFIADAGLSSADYDDFIITYNSSIGGIATRKYIGETTDNWGNPIPQYRTNFIDLSNWSIVSNAEIYFNGAPNSFLQSVGYNGTYTTSFGKLFRESSHFEYSDLKQYFTDPSIVGVIGYYARTYNQTGQYDDSYTVDHIREVRLGENYTDTFYIKPLEHL